MKESVKGLKEADDVYSQQVQALNEIKEGLVYKEGARKGEIRDNFHQIMNTLDGPNRSIMAERLNNLRPGLVEEIQAVHHMKKLADAYYRTPVVWKNLLSKGMGLVLGGAGGFSYGPLGIVAGALAGFFAEQGLTKLSQSRVQHLIDGLGKETQLKLERIGDKLEQGKALTAKEDHFMQDIAEQLQNGDTKKDGLGGEEPSPINPNNESIQKIDGNANQSYQKIDGTQIDYKNRTDIRGKDFSKRQFSNKYQLPLADNLKGKTHIVEAVKLGELEKGSLAQVPAEAFFDGKARPLELTTDRYAKIFQKHGPFSHENLIATANDWDYMIKDLNGEEGHINLIKELPDGSSLLIGAKRDNGALVVTHFEPTKSVNKVLDDAKKNGGEVIERGLGKFREGAETKYQLAEPIKSENFKQWFGDWENDPKNASKVVDENGEPLVVYHGTEEDFTIFDKNKARLHADIQGMYFAIDPMDSSGYGSKVGAYYLDIKNPADESTAYTIFRKYQGQEYAGVKTREELQEMGYDGVIVIDDEEIAEIIAFEPSQIKSATDNIGSFDPSNPDIRYQKHGVANPLEKSLSAERATQLENIRNGKSVQELADHYGIDIKTVEKITTPEGLQAYGKYGDGVITLAETIKEGTAPHELFHATFDLVDQERKSEILEAIMQEKKLDVLNAEEYLADSFADYFRSGKFDTKTFGTGLVEKIKQFFQQVKEWINGTAKNRRQVKQLFDEILDGEVDREMLGGILDTKKSDATLNQLHKAEGSLVTSLKKSIQINPNNARDFKKNLNNIDVSQLNPEGFLMALKQALGVGGESSYLNNTLGDGRYSLRISNHNANARNHKVRGNLENNTSLVIKLSDSRFKAKNGVDLIEFVYNPENLTPEKMQGIIKGVQDWIDTGEYTDKGYDHTHKSIRAILENGEVKYQRVYHGSPYEFDRFDSSHMGEGEGGQAHGWGHYVAVDISTARNYATMKGGVVEYKGKTLEDFFNSSEGSTYSSIEKEIISDIANNISEYFDKPDEARDRAQMEYERAIENGEDISYNRSKLNTLKSLDYDDFVDKGGNVYEVEIPDPVKANTPTGSNYLEEQGKIKSRAVDAIVKQLKKGLSQEKILQLDELIDSWESGYDHSIEGGRMYRIIANTLGSDHKASIFLQSLGYDGIHYHGGRDGEAYVIFDDDKLEIKKHWDNGVEKYQYVEDDLNKGSLEQIKRQFPNLKAIGQGEFGTIYEGVKGADAEKLLISQKGGEVRGAYTYKGEPVDLIRGGYNKKTESGIGLSKIFQKHPEVIGRIQQLLDDLPVVKRNFKEIILGNQDSIVVIKLQFLDKEKRWIMTAYDKNKLKLDIKGLYYNQRRGD